MYADTDFSFENYIETVFVWTFDFVRVYFINGIPEN